MTRCVFSRIEPVGGGWYKQTAECGIVRFVPDAAPMFKHCSGVCGRPVAPQMSAVPECQHRGAEFSLVNCVACGEGFRVKVFPCAVHGQCAIGPNKLDLPACVSCPDRSCNLPDEC